MHQYVGVVHGQPKPEQSQQNSDRPSNPTYYPHLSLPQCLAQQTRASPAGREADRLVQALVMRRAATGTP